MESQPDGRIASRGGAVLIVLTIILLVTVLPRRYHYVPNWFGYTAAALTLLAMILVWLLRSPAYRRLERIAEFTGVGVALVANCVNLLVSAYNLVEHPGVLEPVPLFYTSIAIWTGNILIFTLIYWLVDSGGPDARLHGSVPYPDFVFPAMDDPERVPPNWRPEIIDYLFLGFTTSTAFSPTEAMPYTSRAKALVLVQSSISLITVAVVAARTINILK